MDLFLINPRLYILFQACAWGKSVDFGIDWLSNYFSSQVKMPNNYGQGPTLTLDEQITQKATTGQPPMGRYPEGVRKNEAN